ncbi:MAG: helix-turn-helix transcriptional regulator, partial [Planctomycetota bacterium]
QVAALLKNESKYIPMEALSKICDYLNAMQLWILKNGGDNDVRTVLTAHNACEKSKIKLVSQVQFPAGRPPPPGTFPAAPGTVYRTNGVFLEGDKPAIAILCVGRRWVVRESIFS